MAKETKTDKVPPACPRCGAPLDPRGPGIRACSDCGYEVKTKTSKAKK